MDNPDNNRQRAFDEAVKKVDQIRDLIGLRQSRGVTLLLLDSFLTFLFNHHNSLFIEATFTEFYPVYLKLLSRFTATGSPLANTRSILENARRLYSLDSGEFKDPNLATEIKRLIKERKELMTFLKGDQLASQDADVQICFPVIESVENTVGFTYLEGLDIKLSPGTSDTKFIIHPTYKDEDPLLMQQVKTAFEVAIKSVPQGKKPLSGTFEVQIFFKSNLGDYSGNSFGSLLTMLFIRELVKLNSPNMIPGINPGTAFTGAVDESGRIISVGRSNMIRKVKSIFFSGLSRFIVPHADEATANAVVEKLNKRWPGRKLEIIAVKEISEIMNRRDLFLVSRKPVRQRIKETAQRYRYASLLLIPILVLLGFMYAREFDDNPVAFELEGTDLNIKNRYGKVLWSWLVHPNVPAELTDQELRTRIRIIDIDGDGVNEIISSGDLIEYSNFKVFYSLFCYNNKKEVIWNFSFVDTVSSPKEKNIPGEYGHHVYDTVTLGRNKALLAYSNSAPTYTAALYFLDLKTGKRIGSTLWNAGFIYQLAIADVNNDNKKDLVFLARDNSFGYHKIVAVEFPFPDGMLPSRPDYMLYGKKIVEPIIEIKLPETDYTTKLSGNTTDIFLGRSCTVDSLLNIGFFSRYAFDISAAMYKLILNSKTHEIDYFIEGAYRNFRDSLVNIGKLPPPYTDTKEYTDILKNGVRYKLNGRWLTYQEYKRARLLKTNP